MNGPCCVLAEVVDRDDVGVVQRGGGQGLLAEAGEEVRIATVLGAEDLDRDVAIELGVVGAVDASPCHPGRGARSGDTARRGRCQIRQIVSPIVSGALGRPHRSVPTAQHAAPARVQTVRGARP